MSLRIAISCEYWATCEYWDDGEVFDVLYSGIRCPCWLVCVMRILNALHPICYADDDDFDCSCLLSLDELSVGSMAADKPNS